MPFPSGYRLDHFEILSLLGQGGMGEVYKARDTRLDRIVAIKVSQAQFSERFTREAKVISSLNHPNICALYDVGTQDGLHYLVMEYLEGKPLEGPLPLDKLQRYAMEIAAALDAAHRKGVTHRDLKPDNILVTAAGVKLLDFGLAKTSVEPGQLDVTVRKALTQEGVIMGTFPYMAPEQLEGKDADARSDIWAFGAVLYEMATGKRAFPGQTQATVIASIMHVAPPPVTEAVASLPASLNRIVRRALQKDPEERWQSARDMLIELRELTTAPAPTPVAPAPAATTRLWRWAAIGLGLAAAGLAAVLLMDKTEPPRKVHMEIVPPAEMVMGPRVSRISPDGRKLLLSMGPLAVGGELYIRHLDSPTFQRLEGTRATTDAAWSPDSMALAYVNRGNIVRVQVDGTSRQTLAVIEEAEGIAWGKPGILVGQQKGPLLLLPPTGGTTTPATQLDAAAGHTSHSGPYMLPDGTRFLFRVQAGNRNAEGIYIGSVGGAIRKVPGLTQTRNFAGFGFFPERTHTAVRAIDLDNLTVGSGVAISLPGGITPSISDNGTLFYIAREQLGEPAGKGLRIVNRNGAQISLLQHPDARSYRHPEFAPDGKRLLFETDGQLWVGDLARKAFTVVAREGFAFSGAWSADGRTIAFSSRGLMWQVPSEGGEPAVLGPGGVHHVQMIGPGEFIGDSGLGGSATLLQHLTFSGTRTTRNLVSEPAMNPQLSPGRKWLAYDRFAGETRAIFLQSWPDGKLVIPVPGGTGSCPRWRSDGKELFFLGPNGRIMSLTVTDKGDKLDFSPATSLPLVTGVARFSVSPDGQMFALATEADGRDSATKIHVILNWRGGK